MSIKNIPQTNLIIDSEFLLDESILNFGMLIPNSSKGMNRIYYSLEYTHNELVKNEKTKEEFEKNPKYNYHFYNDEIEGNYSSLNYSEFGTNFSFNDWSYDFQTIVIERTLNDLLSSIKTEILNSKTDAKAKLFFEDLLKLIDGSNFFLTEFSQNQNCNKIQKYASKSFLEFNSKLFEELNYYYGSIFSDLLKKYSAIQKEDFQNKKDKRIRNSIIYKFASFYADGTFSVSSNKTYYQLNTAIENSYSFAKNYTVILGIKTNTLSSLLSQTIGGSSKKNNIFHVDYFDYIKLVYQDFKKRKKEIAPYFEKKYHELLEINTID